MNSRFTSRLTKLLVVITVLGVMSANMSVVNASMKIACLKEGTRDIYIRGDNPVCPKGWTLLGAPVSIFLNAIYEGNMTVSWSPNRARAKTTVPGTGTGSTEGLNKFHFVLSETGSEKECTNFAMEATLSGGGSTLRIKSVSNAICNLKDKLHNGSTFTRRASITGGTGKFARVSPGTLTLTGTLSDENQDEAGSSEKANFTFKLSGLIHTRYPAINQS